MKTSALIKKRPTGYSLVEVIISMGILVIVSQAFVTVMRNVGQKSPAMEERTWATERALVMLDELRAVIGAGETGSNIATLDNYNDDEFVFHYFLTTKEQVTHESSGGTQAWIQNNQEYITARSYASGNQTGPKGYQFVRNIRILKVANDPKVRKIYVRVYYANPNPGLGGPSVPQPRGWVDKDNRGSEIPIAEVFSLAHTSGAIDVPTQVMDIYLVALESSPGWWVRTASLRQLMGDTITNMQIRNPGFEIKSHWIRRMSFGRDLEYTPEINRNLYANNPATKVFDKVYVYPGRVTYTTGSTPDLYYDPNWFTARMKTDYLDSSNNVVDRVERGNADADGGSYALADQFNHAMRYRQELALYSIFKTIDENILRNPGYVQEISYRMLLEALNNPNDTMHAKVINSVIINLHGEMAPIPPLRNVSDAAKDPVEFPAIPYRAVTHPDKLKYNVTLEDPTLKVYAYEYRNATQTSENDLINQVTLFLPGLSTDNLKQVSRLEGSSKAPYFWNDYPGMTTDDPDPGQATFVADNFTRMDGTGGLRIRLYNVTATAHSYFGPAHD